MKTFTLVPGELTEYDIKALYLEPHHIQLSPKSIPKIQRSAEFLSKKAQGEEVIYGVNTGFGKLATQKIKKSELLLLQKNLLYSHATGVGGLLEDDIVALALLFKANSLSRGYSAVRLELIDTLLDFYNHAYYPCVPSKGSVGASGDLAPLAHLSLALLGEGYCRHQGVECTSISALTAMNRTPLILQPKEGLALINGLQICAAVAMKALMLCEHAFQWTMMAGALTMEAVGASLEPFDARIHQLRNSSTQQSVATHFLDLLQDSRKVQKTGVSRVQDPYSLRCQPQILGGVLAQMEQAKKAILNEVNAVSDNPLVFAEEECILSGGNFHGEAISMSADNLALAIAEMGSLSERRTALLVDSHMSGLPSFLAVEPGLQSGFMNAHVTASALCCENKTLATPVSIESLPTSANQEDHVSHAATATRRLLAMLDNLFHILAIEMLAAAQGSALQKNDLRHAKKTQSWINHIQSILPLYQDDRPLGPVISELAKTLSHF